MYIDPDFKTPEDILDLLTKTIGKLIVEVTGAKVIVADEDTIPKVEGEYILVDESALDPVDWITGEMRDEEGNAYSVQNYQTTYTLTAYRGKRPHVTLSRVMQAFGLPFMYEKYFPLGSPFAYSSSSTVNKMRVPLNAQYFENRARVQIIFNLAFIQRDTGSFEELEQINIDLGVTYVDDRNEIPVTINVGNGITSTSTSQ